MKRWSQFRRACLLLALIALAVKAEAVTNSGTGSVALSAAVATSITVALSASAENFNVTPGAASNPGSGAITCTTTWRLKPGGGAQLALYAYFNSAAAALVGIAAPANTVPSSAIEMSLTGGAPFSRVSNTTAFGAPGASLQLWIIGITGINKNSSRVDNFTFNFNASTLPQLPADSYQGTMFIEAQATP